MTGFAGIVRRQLRAPLFAVIVVMLVAAVVAFNASAFTAIHALRWKALPYAQGDRLVELQARLVKYGFDVGLTERLRQLVLADTTHFSGALGFAAIRGAGEDGRTWQMARVTPEFTALLGVEAALGRSFIAEDARAGADAVLVLSDAIWRSRFNGDASAIGQEVRFSDRDYRIIGVMPPGFAFPDAATEAWRPYVMSAAERELDEQNNVGILDVMARLQPGVSVAQAQAALSSILHNDASLRALRDSSGLEAGARSWRERYSGSYFQALVWFQLAAVILLVAVLANLVNLQLDRLLARRREFEVRRALGASGRTIARGVLAELAPSVVVGLVLGLLLTPVMIDLLVSRQLLPNDLPQGTRFGAAAVVCAFLVGVATLISGLLAVFVVARGTRLSSRAGVTGMGRLRPAMLVAQVMLTTALLGSAGLLLRSAVILVNADPGFESRGVLLSLIDPVGVTVAGTAFDPALDSERFAPLVERIRSAVAGLPGVDQVAVGSAPPFSGWEAVSQFRVPDRGEDLQARLRSAGPGYFAALGIDLLVGREFDASDRAGSSGVIVDELYRERYLANADPLNAYVDVPSGEEGDFRRARILGVAQTVKHETLEEATRMPTVYQFNSAPLPVFWLVSRTAGDTLALAETVRRTIQSVAPGTTIGINEPLAARVEVSLSSRRALLEAFTGFAVGALLLAGIGLAAVLSFAMRRRNGELGVRMALGATRAGIRNLVLRQGGGLIGVGLLLGLGTGLGLARALGQRLVGVRFDDPLTWSATLGLVGTVALVACWLPAHRAAATDPMIVLRSE